MSRIVLINPTDHTQIRKSLGLKAPPLNLLYLAAAVRADDHKVKIIDDNLAALGPERTADSVARQRPEIVGITAATSTVRSAFRYVAMVRERLPDAMLLIGGPHTTFLPEEALVQSPGLDAVVMGEGEETFRELARAAETGWTTGDLARIKGIAFRENGSARLTPPRELLKDLDSLPLPARDLVDYGAYRDPVKKRPIGSMITSRGCVYGCAYCASSRIMGKRFRMRRPEPIVDEMEELVSRYGAEDIEFIDDNFMLDRRRAGAVAEELQRRDLDVSFVASSRVDNVDAEVLRRLKGAGLASLYYGIESGCQRVLDLMHKGITLQQAKDAVKAAKESRIKVLGSFIFGYPGETLAEMRKTVAFSTHLGLDYAQYSILTPYPGTPIHADLQAKGLLSAIDYDHYTVLEPIIDYERLGLSGRKVQKMLNAAYLRFYLRPGYILRHPFVLRMGLRAALAQGSSGGEEVHAPVDGTETAAKGETISA
jgi:anaerobic magnesium-protoporphyrin IX monomethyl ester cyclase